MAIYERKDADLKESIAEGFAFVDFYGSNCGPCRMLEPVIESVEAEMPFVKFIKVNIEENVYSQEEFQVMATPTLVLTRDGEVLDRHIGFMDEDSLSDWIGQNMYR